jgi:hypothetical protein
MSMKHWPQAGFLRRAFLRAPRVDPDDVPAAHLFKESHMGRAIAGVVVGFLLAGVIVSAANWGALAALGPEKMFVGDTLSPSSTNILIDLVGALAGALIGGLTCVMIAKSFRAAVILALIVFVLGVIFVFPAMTRAKEEPVARTANMSLVEMASNARLPVWLAMLHPAIGVVGVLAGGAIGARGEKKKK